MARTARQPSPQVTPHVHQSYQPTYQTKHEERLIKDPFSKSKKLESYLADDENFPNFAYQLAKSGLELRDIPGDGNCLFRALGDQIEGHGRNHYRHRCDIIDYMATHSDDFEPFLESDIPFVEYLHQLRNLGTYAGNDAIMAFAKLHCVNVVIHQLNAPHIIIYGGQTQRQIHLAYHNGDHYSSIRRLHDNTESPTAIHLTVGNACDSQDAGQTKSHDATSAALEQNVMRLTGCTNTAMIRRALEDNDMDQETAVADIMQQRLLSCGNGMPDTTYLSASGSNSSLWSENGTGTRLFCGGGAKPKHVSKKERKLDKQMRATERHKQAAASPPLPPNQFR